MVDGHTLIDMTVTEKLFLGSDGKHCWNRCKGTQVSAFSLHPGVIKTSLGRSFNTFLADMFYFLATPFLRTIPQGVATTIYAATAPELDGRYAAFRDQLLWRQLLLLHSDFNRQYAAKCQEY